MSAFSAFQKGNTIELAWTIAAGNTCEGTFVDRSVNGSEPVPVFAIGGICGSSDRAEPYRFTDTDTGANGTYAYSFTFGSVWATSVEVQFLILWDAGFLVYYDSSTGVHRFRIDSQGRPYRLQVLTLTGKIVHSVEAKDSELYLPSAAWGNGIYILSVELGNRIIRQKFMLLR